MMGTLMKVKVNGSNILKRGSRAFGRPPGALYYKVSRIR